MVVERIHSHRNQHHDQPHLQYFKCVYSNFCWRSVAMVRFFRCKILQSPRRVYAVFLAFALLLGVILGSLCSGFAEPVLFLLMRTAAESRVSIVCLLPVMLLPIFLSAFAVSSSKTVLMLLICFSKAFLFSFVSLGISQTYGSAGWLIRSMLLFSDCLTTPMLYWFWLRHLPENRPYVGWETFGMSALGILIGSVDYRIISPFLASLIEF